MSADYFAAPQIFHGEGCDAQVTQIRSMSPFYMGTDANSLTSTGLLYQNEGILPPQQRSRLEALRRAAQCFVAGMRSDVTIYAGNMRSGRKLATSNEDLVDLLTSAHGLSGLHGVGQRFLVVHPPMLKRKPNEGPPEGTQVVSRPDTSGIRTLRCRFQRPVLDLTPPQLSGKKFR